MAAGSPGTRQARPSSLSMALAHRGACSALLVIDMQEGVVAQAWKRNEVIGRINELIGRARREAMTVVWIQHQSEELPAGTPAWRIVTELVPVPGEPVIAKHYRDAFEATDLENTLAAREVGRLYVTGAQTDYCVRSTLHGALVRGYDTWLVADAHTTDDMSSWGAPSADKVVAHTNLYWADQAAPGRSGHVVLADDVDFARVLASDGLSSGPAAEVLVATPALATSTDTMVAGLVRAAQSARVNAYAP